MNLLFKTCLLLFSYLLSSCTCTPRNLSKLEQFFFYKFIARGEIIKKDTISYSHYDENGEIIGTGDAIVNVAQISKVYRKKLFYGHQTANLDTVLIFSGNVNETDCGITFELKQDYLFFCEEVDDCSKRVSYQRYSFPFIERGLSKYFYTNICHRTSFFSTKVKNELLKMDSIDKSI
jgi:hypothetical protein